MITADCQHELEVILNGYLDEGDWAPDWVGAKVDGQGRYRVIAKREIDTTRWSRWDMVIVRGPAQSLWGFDSECGLTELQEVERPDAYEVYPVDVVTVAVSEYRRAK